MIEATVCIPWRATPSRQRPFERVVEFYKTHFPDWPILAADSNDRRWMFNLAQARNNAVRAARTEIVVVNDADTIPPLDGIRAAVADPGRATRPLDCWRSLPTRI